MNNFLYKMSEEGQIVISNLKSKIEHIISAYESAIYENKELKEKLAASQQELETNKKTIKELGEKLEMQQLANAFKGSSQDIKEAKQRIARIVREIDKCISLLND